MQEKNKKLLKHIGENDKKVIFHPNIGLGQLLFTSTIQDVISILGEPQERDKYDNDENSYSISLSYYGPQMTVYFYHENDKLENTSFHCNNLILDSVKFSDQPKHTILEFIKSYHFHNGYEYKLNFEYDEYVGEESWSFESIGLTIWFEGEDFSEISDICVSKVIEE